MGSSMNGAYDPNVSALPPAMPPYDAHGPNALPPNMQNMQSLQNLKDETNLNGAVAKSEQSLQTQSQTQPMAMFDPALVAAYNQNMIPNMMGALQPPMSMDANAMPNVNVPMSAQEIGQPQTQSEQTDGDEAVTATVPTATTTTTEIATDATSDVKGEQAQAQNQVLPPAPMAYDMQQMTPAAYPQTMPLTGDYAQAMQGMQMPAYYYSGMAGSMAGMTGANSAYYMNYDQMGQGIGQGMAQSMYGMAPSGMGMPMQMGLEDATKKIECPPLPIDEEENE